MNKLQSQYDFIYSLFRTTTEPFDELEWDGKVLDVWLNNEKIESYMFSELKGFGLINDTSWKEIFDE